MILLAIKITLPWWMWGLLLIGLPAVGAFFAWNNKKEDVEKKAEDTVKNIVDKK